VSSIVAKRQGGKTYYSASLGSAEEVGTRLAETGPGEPDRTRHLAFGDVAAVWSMLERLGLAGIMDEMLVGRRGDAAASVGTYVALATANGSSTRARDGGSPTGGEPRPAIGGCSLARRRWITGGSGRPWTPSPRASAKQSSGAS